MVWGPILGGIASGVLGLIGGERRNDASAQQAQMTNQFNADQAQENRDFQEKMFWKQFDVNNTLMERQNAHNAFQAGRQMDFQTQTMNTAMAYDTAMSNSQYQRGMADMKAAGLNPLLAYHQGGASSPQIGGMQGAAGSGSGASVSAPGGATASGQQALMENTLGPAVSSALQGAATVGQLRQLAAQTALTEEQADVARANARNINVNTGLQTAQTITETGRPDLVRSQVNLNTQGVETQRASARLSNTTADLAPALAGSRTAADWAAVGELGAREAQQRQNTQADQTYGRVGAGRSNPVEPISQLIESIRRSLQ